MRHDEGYVPVCHDFAGMVMQEGAVWTHLDPSVDGTPSASCAGRFEDVPWAMGILVTTVLLPGFE